MTLENDFLKISITENGGSLTSIFNKKNNKELLYQPMENSWQGQDICIFPFIARLKDGYYIDENKKYFMKNHGLIRYMKANKIFKSDDSITLGFNSNNETIKQYPYEFELEIQYTLINNVIRISYNILNLSNKDMPFMLGAHPAFKVDCIFEEDYTNIDGNYILFDTNKEINRIKQDETASFCTKDEIGFIKDSRLNLTKNLFKQIDTIILRAEGFTNLKLIKKCNEPISINKGNAQFIALRSDGPFGDFVCIEPWLGTPDYVDCNRELKEKKNINILKSNKTFNYSYEIEVDY